MSAGNERWSNKKNYRKQLVIIIFVGFINISHLVFHFYLLICRLHGIRNSNRHEYNANGIKSEKKCKW